MIFATKKIALYLVICVIIYAIIFFVSYFFPIQIFVLVRKLRISMCMCKSLCIFINFFGFSLIIIFHPFTFIHSLDQSIYLLLWFLRLYLSLSLCVCLCFSVFMCMCACVCLCVNLVVCSLFYIIFIYWRYLLLISRNSFSLHF